MKSQRQQLIDQLRSQMSNDNILHAMIGESASSQGSVIDEYLQKPREMADTIRQNLTAQDNILKYVLFEHYDWVGVSLCHCVVVVTSGTTSDIHIYPNNGQKKFIDAINNVINCTIFNETEFLHYLFVILLEL